MSLGVYSQVGDAGKYPAHYVDVCMIRRLVPDKRSPYGLAYLDPRFDCAVQGDAEVPLPDVRVEWTAGSQETEDLL